MRYRRCSLRRGLTLVETVQVITITGLLLSLSSIVLGNAIRVHRVAIDGYQELKSLDLFSQRWRNDVERATQMPLLADLESGAGSKRLELVVGEGLISYEFAEGSITRNFRHLDGAVGIERWRLPVGAEGIFAIRFTSLGGLAELVELKGVDELATGAEVTSERLLVARVMFALHPGRGPHEWLAVCTKQQVSTPMLDRQDGLSSTDDGPSNAEVESAGGQGTDE